MRLFLGLLVLVIGCLAQANHLNDNYDGRYSDHVDHHRNHYQGDRYDRKGENRDRRDWERRHDRNGRRGTQGKTICSYYFDVIPTNYLNTSSDFDRAPLLEVANGATLEIVGYGFVTFQGQSQEGVQLKVISNPNALSFLRAAPGQIVWNYKVLADQQLTCR